MGLPFKGGVLFWGLRLVVFRFVLVLSGSKLVSDGPPGHVAPQKGRLKPVSNQGKQNKQNKNNLKPKEPNLKNPDPPRQLPEGGLAEGG